MERVGGFLRQWESLGELINLIGLHISSLDTLNIWLSFLLDTSLQISTQLCGKLGIGRTLCTEQNANANIITTGNNNHHPLLSIVH